MTIIKRRFLYILAMSGVIGFETLSQIFMKLVSKDLNNIPFGILWLKTGLSHLPIWLSLTSDLLNFFCWMLILRFNNLSSAFPISSLCYVTVVGSGYFIFGELIPLKAFIGIAFIVSGTFLIGLIKET